jgi:hypothetical protein
MERNIDDRMSRLCGRLMSVAQNARDAQEYILEEMEYIAEANPDREDVRACIEEIKSKNKASESVNWTVGNHWSEHFDGISATEKEPQEETPKDEQPAEGEEGAAPDNDADKESDK